MKCNKCEAASDVLETRTAPNFVTVRRRKCHNGHIFKTFEMHAELMSVVKHRLEAHARGVKASAVTYWRDREIARRLDRGDDIGALALEYGFKSLTGVRKAAARGRIKC